MKKAKKKEPVKELTPRQILLEKWTQAEIADICGCSRQAVSIAFARGRLSYEMAHILSRKMRIPVDRLLTQWIPHTNRKAKQSHHVKRRLAALGNQPPA
jgi:transcriptional regulator with XRE-family HTH domain